MHKNSDHARMIDERMVSHCLEEKKSIGNDQKLTQSTTFSSWFSRHNWTSYVILSGNFFYWKKKIFYIWLKSSVNYIFDQSKALTKLNSVRRITWEVNIQGTIQNSSYFFFFIFSIALIFTQDRRRVPIGEWLWLLDPQTCSHIIQ